MSGRNVLVKASGLNIKWLDRTTASVHSVVKLYMKHLYRGPAAPLSGVAVGLIMTGGALRAVICKSILTLRKNWYIGLILLRSYIINGAWRSLQP